MMSRPLNSDWYWWLREPIKKVVNEHGLLPVCRKARCEKGRKSIEDWLFGREDGPKDKQGNPVPRALKHEHAQALASYLRDNYPDEARRCRKEGADWLASVKAQNDARKREETAAYLRGMADEMGKLERTFEGWEDNLSKQKKPPA
jgi:hypothetical protein